MPQLDEKSYARFHQMLEELAEEVPDMKETPRSFMQDMIDKDKTYGERMFVSVKQFQWVERLHQEYVGDTDHAVNGDDRDPRDDRDMDDDVPY